VPRGGRADGGDGRRLAPRGEDLQANAGGGWRSFSPGRTGMVPASTFLIASLNGGFPFWHRYFDNLPGPIP
jgi:hypothetical protein